MLAVANGTAAAATVTLPVPASGQEIRLTDVTWSYNAAPTGGELTITGLQSGVTFDMDITSAGPGAWPTPEHGNVKNTNIVITLASGGGGVTGKLNVFYRLV